MAAIAATLARYNEGIITAVTHPVSGLPGKKSWLPTVKEVHYACDEIDEFECRQVARKRGIQEQFEARRQEDINNQREYRPTAQEIKAKYGENWGLTQLAPKTADEFKAPSWQAISSIYSADPSRIKRLMKISDDWREASEPSAATK